MFEHVGLVVLNGFKDRAQSVNDYLCDLLGEKRNYIIAYLILLNSEQIMVSMVTYGIAI